MLVVLDASVALCWTLDDQEGGKAYADSVYKAAQAGTIKIAVPDVFHKEVAHNLLKKGRFKKTSATVMTEQAEIIADAISETLYMNHTAPMIVNIGLAYHVQAYDAQYLVLAMQKQAAIATLDKGLIAACKRQNVPIWQT